MNPPGRRGLQPLAATAFAGVLLISASGSAAASQPATVHVLLDVRAEWSRTVSACVTEGVFFGFHSGTAQYLDQGAEVVAPENVAGVWWYQTDACDEANSFFVTGDVLLEPGDFFIDRSLGSAWVDAEVTVPLGSMTYTFTFDLTYRASGDVTVSVIHDGSSFIRRERLVPAEITGAAASDVPGGFAGFDLVWSDIGHLTQIQSGG